MAIQRATMLRLLRPCAASCLRDLEGVRPVYEGEHLGDWVRWWVAEVKGAHPPLRKYPIEWVESYVRVLHARQHNMYTTSRDMTSTGYCRHSGLFCNDRSMAFE